LWKKGRGWPNVGLVLRRMGGRDLGRGTRVDLKWHVGLRLA
jgi:hypothetical protein